MSANTALWANQPEFDFQAGPHTVGELAVVSFEAHEFISHPYSVEVRLAASRGVEVDCQALLGESARLTVHLGNGTARFFHGVVGSLSRSGDTPLSCQPQYLCTLVPRFWLLRHTRRSRIFQNLSVPQIVKKVLGEAQVACRLSLQGSYPKRPYCTQYQESDSTFVSRLLGEEGLFYFFEHSEQAHTLVVGDSAGATAALPGSPTLPFRERSRLVAAQESLFELTAQYQIQPSTVTLRDFNFLRPDMDLTTSCSAEAEPYGLEFYEYPGGYEEPSVGRARARVRLEELRASACLYTGASYCRRLCPGYTFELQDHPEGSFNLQYLLLSVHHVGRQPEALLGSPAVVGSQEGYRNELTFISASTPFRPRRHTQRPFIAGAQTALVVGPEGEEIYTDEHGQIKVQFHWDREGQKDEHSSCWLRVSQAWAGQGWGALYLPRQGQEVLVEFLDGDPDRPVVVGSLYNGNHLTPVELPAHKTQSTLRSSSTPGGEGSNELRFEDAAGAELLYVHAQKDLHLVVENDKHREVRGSETLLVKKDRSRTVEGHQSLEVKKDESSVIGGSQSLVVDKDRTTAVLGHHTESVAGDQSLSVGGSQNTTVALASVETVGLGKTLNVGGALAVTVGGALHQAVGGLKSEQVGGAKVEVVAGSKSELVNGDRSLLVRGNLSEQVGQSRALQVEQDLTLGVDGKLGYSVKGKYLLSAQQITLVAREQFTLKVGPAIFQIKKNGDVVLKGTRIEFNSRGDVVLKGSNVTEN